MKLKLQFASLFTLGILSGFVLAIITAILYFFGTISATLMISLILIFNFLAWLISPYISDLMNKWFYKVKFYNIGEIENKKLAEFIKQVCKENNSHVPKIGIIPDKNPTAFTYGSASFNARIVLTEGLFHFLNEKEVEAVVAHELGHIIHKDFIVMTIASTLLQILYQMYVIFARRSAGTINKKGEKKGNSLVLIGYVSFIFYILGTYILLYLSRLREYYADEFAAKVTKDANLLSSALLKIAYGIAAVPDTNKTAHLLNATRAQGIFDFKAANNAALIHSNAKNNKSLVEKALLFDIVSPWANILQLSSTHPLIGKRIRRLCSLTDKPDYDFLKIEKLDVDKKKLYKNFFTDLVIYYSTTFCAVGLIAAMFISYILDFKNYQLIAGIFVLIYIALSIMKIRYKLPAHKEFKKTSVIECMSDVYASPLRGSPVELNGSAIGRGQAGYVFGEDMMFQDKTGIIYLNYESAIPIFGNLMFAWKKLETMLNKPAKATGWFLRGITRHIELNNFASEGDNIKSYVRLWIIIGLIFKVMVFIFITYLISGLAVSLSSVGTF